jgi:peptidoglycan hydrolase-like protein with peptidoglycan-binding domain
VERFKEIQQALADRGYFAGQPDGQWGPDSIAALKRFQRDQNIDDDGKLGALSLIGLGLGPRRTLPPERVKSEPGENPGTSPTGTSANPVTSPESNATANSSAASPE